MPLHVTANIEVAEVPVRHQDIVESPVQVKPTEVHQGVVQAVEPIPEIEALPTVHQVIEVLEATSLREAQHQEAVVTEAQVVEVRVVAEVIEAHLVEAVLEALEALAGQAQVDLLVDVLQGVAVAAVEEIDNFNHFV